MYPTPLLKAGQIPGICATSLVGGRSAYDAWGIARARRACLTGLMFFQRCCFYKVGRMEGSHIEELREELAQLLKKQGEILEARTVDL